MDITLSFCRTYGTPELQVVTIHADTAEEASELISHILIELYAKHGPQLSVVQTDTAMLN